MCLSHARIGGLACIDLIGKAGPGWPENSLTSVERTIGVRLCCYYDKLFTLFYAGVAVQHRGAADPSL